MAVKIAERSTYWQNNTNTPSATGDYRYYWKISYEQTDNDKSLNRSKIIVDYYIQTHKTQTVDGWDTIVLPAGTSVCYVNGSSIGSISTAQGVVMIGENYALKHIGTKSTYITHNADGTANFTWQGSGFGKGTAVSTYSLPTIPVKPKYDAIIKTSDGWKKGFTYAKIGGTWRKCEIFRKINSTWRKGSTE